MGGLPGKQMVNGVDGQAQAKTVGVGDRLWTLDGDRTVHTTVLGVTAVKARDMDSGTQAVSYAPDDAARLRLRLPRGCHVCRRHGRQELRVPDRERRRVCVEVREVPDRGDWSPRPSGSRHEPSGFLQRDLPGFRVRVASSYLADVLRQYVGGDAHHMRQGFPRVVLKDLATFEGFLDGYADGDGFRHKHCGAAPSWRRSTPCTWWSGSR